MDITYDQLKEALIVLYKEYNNNPDDFTVEYPNPEESAQSVIDYVKNVLTKGLA